MYGEGVRLGVENVTVERQRVLLRKYHEQVLEALADEEGLHFVEAFRSHLLGFFFFFKRYRNAIAAF